MKRVERGLLALLVAVLGGAAVHAQEHVAAHSVDGREVVTVRSVAVSGALSGGGFGFVQVLAENHDELPHAVHVAVGSLSWGSSNLSVGRDLVLGPREFTRCFLPLPTTADRSLRLDVRVDGVSYAGSVTVARNDNVVGLLVAARSDAEPWGLTVLQALQGSGRPAAEVRSMPPGDLPTDWRLFTGFHAVVVDGRAPVADELQAALVRFARTGGTVVVGEPDRLPAGELRRQCLATDGSGLSRCGLGHCVVVPVGGDTTVLRQRLAAVPQGSGWPVPPPLLATQQVPGLGTAPVLVFLGVILLFAFVVGPLNFVLLRRWRRPLWVLITVPACGLGTTLLMLGYGLVHDGLGVRGVVRSWTLLDQDRHEATSFALRTLFAGLAPDTLTLAADGVLIAPRAAAREDRRSPDRWQFDPATNAVDGGVLPSRQTTPLCSVRHGIARQRLRVRSAGDRLELLTDGGLVPAGAVLLRDPDGRTWAGEAPFLVPLDDVQAARALAQWQREAAAIVWDGHDAPMGDAHALVERLLGGELDRGCFALRATAAPWLDDHGLSVAYDRAEHFVVGRFAAEDFVR